MIPRDKLPGWCGHSGSRKWPYVTLCRVAVTLPRHCGKNILIHSSSGKYIGSISRPGHLVIEPGYTFDGATSAPDIPGLMRARVIHDILCQCCLAEDFPYDRPEVDEFFLDIASMDGCGGLGVVYYAGIALFGGFHRFFNKPGNKDRVSLTFCYDFQGFQQLHA